MASQLANVLLSLTDHAKALAQVQSLEQFQEAAKELCKSYSLSLEHLATARTHCPQTDGNAWQDYSEQGVVMADAVRSVHNQWSSQPCNITADCLGHLAGH